MPQPEEGALENGIHRVVRDVCLWLPEAEEFLSHGSPNFRVRGKTFATYVVNHHGDGRVALWLNAVRGAQESWVGADLPEGKFAAVAATGNTQTGSRRLEVKYAFGGSR